MPRKITRVVDNATGEVLDPRTSPEMYSMYALRNADVWTPENVRREYSRLRKIINERLKTIEGSEYEESQTYLRNIGKYKPIKELTQGQIKGLLWEASKMLQAETGTLTGLRRADRRRVASLQEHGFTGITMKNIRQFGHFMEAWRSREELRGYGSPTAAELYNAVVHKGLDPQEVMKEFSFWLQHTDELEALPRRKSREPADADYYRAMIEEDV